MKMKHLIAFSLSIFLSGLVSAQRIVISDVLSNRQVVATPNIDESKKAGKPNYTEREVKGVQSLETERIVVSTPQNNRDVVNSSSVNFTKRQVKSTTSSRQQSTPKTSGTNNVSEKNNTTSSSVVAKKESTQPSPIQTAEPKHVEPVKKEIASETKPSTIIHEGAIQAIFTVGENKKIYFSKGNLQYQASSKIWRFADNQYDMIGADNAQVSSSNSHWIDLFGWATSGWDNGNTYYMPYNTETASATSGYGYGPTNGQTYGISLKGAFAEADWGVANKIEDAGDSAGIWRTLSRAEWGYLLVKRPFADNLYSLATIENVKGMILLPDNWESVEGVTFVPTAGYDKNVYSKDQWEKMETAGAVFLPSAGCRYGTTVGNAGTTGSYWSITADGDEKAWYFIFNKSTVDINSEFSRGLGRSVRLVKDVQ